MSDITDRLDEMIEWFASDSTVTRDSIIDLLEDARNEIADLKAKLAAAEADAGQVTGETSGGNCDHVTRRRLGKMCQCLDYCERKDPYSKNPAGVCRGQPTRKGVGSE